MTEITLPKWFPFIISRNLPYIFTALGIALIILVSSRAVRGKNKRIILASLCWLVALGNLCLFNVLIWVGPPISIGWYRTPIMLVHSPYGYFTLFFSLVLLCVGACALEEEKPPEDTTKFFIYYGFFVILGVCVGFAFYPIFFAVMAGRLPSSIVSIIFSVLVGVFVFAQWKLRKWEVSYSYTLALLVGGILGFWLSFVVGQL